VQERDVGAHLDAQLRVEVGERLVHQQRVGLTHDRAAHRDPLPLPAGELARLALEQAGEAEHLRRRADAIPDLLLLQPVQPEPEAHVVVDGHVRVEGVVLEDHRHVPVLRIDLVDALAADPDLARGGLLEPGRDPQHRRLPRAGRPDQHDELAVLDREVELLDRRGAVVEDLRQAGELDACHQPAPLLAAAIRSRYQRALRFGIRRCVSKST
jgi:hypothetical protein